MSRGGIPLIVAAVIISPFLFQIANAQNNATDCSSNPCQNGGVCTNGNPGFSCNCDNTGGYGGSTCDEILQCSTCKQNEICVTDANAANGFRCESCGTYCGSNAICSSSDVVPYCTCKDGWTGVQCTVDINECDTIPNICNGFPCVNNQGSYSCTCNNGNNGNNCNPPKCSPNPCNLGTCKEVNSGYTCVCPVGFEGNDCETNVDDCDPNPCSSNNNNHEVCVDGIDSHSCICKDGWTGTSTGGPDTSCNVAQESVIWIYCSVNKPCQNGGTCQPNAGGTDYECLCTAQYTGNNCQTERNPCSPNPCNAAQNAGTCAAENTNVDGYVCTCDNGWSGVTCSNDVDECILNQPCTGIQVCTNSPGSYSCDCPTNTQPSGDTCEAENPCGGGIECNGGVCNDDGSGTQQCVCPDGSSYIEIEDGCQDINECDTGSNACTSVADGGTCTNDDPFYTCGCQSPLTPCTDNTLLCCGTRLWAPWSSCSKTCNFGRRTRTRTCTGPTCGGVALTEEGTCNTDLCPLTTQEAVSAVFFDITFDSSVSDPLGVVSATLYYIADAFMKNGNSFCSEDVTNAGICCGVTADSGVTPSGNFFDHGDIYINPDDLVHVGNKVTIKVMCISSLDNDLCNSLNTARRRKRQASSSSTTFFTTDQVLAILANSAGTSSTYADSLKALTNSDLNPVISNGVAASDVAPVDDGSIRGPGSGTGTGTGTGTGGGTGTGTGGGTDGGTDGTDSGDEDEVPWWVILLVVLAILFLLIVIIIIIILMATKKSTAVGSSQQALQQDCDADSLASQEELAAVGRGGAAGGSAGTGRTSRSAWSDGGQAPDDDRRTGSRLAWADGQEQQDATRASSARSRTSRPRTAGGGAYQQVASEPSHGQLREEPPEPHQRVSSPPGTSDYEEKRDIDDKVQKAHMKSQANLREDPNVKSDAEPSNRGQVARGSKCDAEPSDRGQAKGGSKFPKAPSPVDTKKTWEGVSKKKRQELEYV